ncbi:hypothetical protein [Streptomyces sp. NPDC046909]|uniref:hypothetical protein n=1 Tax=Streptomyces sp. NPDC046909 TaxID=3155617 RepID=UPI0033D6ACE9
MTTQTSGFRPGQILKRTEIHPVLGGSGFAGICPAIEKKNVLIFSDSKVGERYGYRDGWLAEDDDIGPIFTYTGVGKRGDQALEGGNKAILEHADKGRTLHLFVAVGKAPGSEARTHLYVGTFKLDTRKPFDIREATDELGANRNVIVFRLRPTGPCIRREEDTLPRANTVRSRFNRTAAKLTRTYRRQRRQHVQLSDVERVAAARDDLADTFEESSLAAGETIGQLEVTMRDATAQLMVELYNPTSNTVYEPAGSAASESIAEAMTQLLLARHHLRSVAHSQPLHLMVLSPELPREDLRNLLAEHGIGVVYRNETGGFSEFATSPTSTGGAPRAFRCLDCPVPA